MLIKNYLLRSSSSTLSLPPRWLPLIYGWATFAGYYTWFVLKVATHQGFRQTAPFIEQSLNFIRFLCNARVIHKPIPHLLEEFNFIHFVVSRSIECGFSAGIRTISRPTARFRARLISGAGNGEILSRNFSSGAPCPTRRDPGHIQILIGDKCRCQSLDVY